MTYSCSFNCVDSIIIGRWMGTCMCLERWSMLPQVLNHWSMLTCISSAWRICTDPNWLQTLPLSFFHKEKNQDYIPLNPSAFLVNIPMMGLFNSLALGKCGSNFKSIIFKLIIQNSTLGTCCEIVLRSVSQNLSNEKLILIHVMAWCYQATSHNLIQCWPSFVSTYGITRR